MNNVISMSDFKDRWERVLQREDPAQGTTLEVYLNRHTGESDFVMVSEDGKSMSTLLPAHIVAIVADLLKAL